MGHSVLNWACVFALVASVTGCTDETTATGGTGGSGDTGGDGGTGGTRGSAVECEGTICPCTEAGIRAAIAEAGGPYTFECDGPTTVMTEATIEINNDVILDGEGNLTVDGNEDHGWFSVPEGVVTMTNSTVSGNAFGSVLNQGEMTVTNSLVDGDCNGDIVSDGYNIESPGNTCGFDQQGDQASVSAEDLNLGELADNGGPTQTHALLPGSVAIDVIPADMCEVDADQRGVDRPQGDACDVGAFEVAFGACLGPSDQDAINTPDFEAQVMDCADTEVSILCLINVDDPPSLSEECGNCYADWIGCAVKCRVDCPDDCDDELKDCSGMPEVFPGSE